MMKNMQITFLGTSSGGGPSPSRNCSSLVASVMGNGTLWMVDCAEGTTRQFHTQPRGSGEEILRAHKVTKIFVTHMHADHVMGIVPFLRHVLFPPTIVDGSEALPSAKPPPRIDIYGPAGLRTFVRSILTMTLTRTADTYAVHELLTPQCPRTSCDAESLHSSECPGLDFVCDEQGFWRAFVVALGRHGDVIVDAGPIFHRVTALSSDPCIGYIIKELRFPNRKLAILGDTSDASAIESLLSCPPPSLLIHEATDAYIPTSVDPQARRMEEQVQEKVLARGHSTPAMAGAFARRVGAARLVLNHIGSRFPAPRQLKNAHDARFAVIDEISRQASEAWGMGHAQVAFDFMRITVPAPPISTIQVEEEVVAVVTVGESSTSNRINVGDSENGGAAYRSTGQRGNEETRVQRGRGRRGRGWRMRGNYGGGNGQRRSDGKARIRSETRSD